MDDDEINIPNAFMYLKCKLTLELTKWVMILN